MVLIGHSQGTLHLRKLIAEEIETQPAQKARLISGLLIGGNVLVAGGADRRERHNRHDRKRDVTAEMRRRVIDAARGRPPYYSKAELVRTPRTRVA